ncbi:MAG: hypothetical protein WC436_02200 [Candidatus Babeliales bacterium]
MFFKKIILLFLFIFLQNFQILAMQKHDQPQNIEQKNCSQNIQDMQDMQDANVLSSLLTNLKIQILLAYFITITINFNYEDFYEDFLNDILPDDMEILKIKSREINQRYCDFFLKQKENCAQRINRYKNILRKTPLKQSDKYIIKNILKNINKNKNFYKGIAKIYFNKRLSLICTSYTFKLFNALNRIIFFQKTIQENPEIKTNEITKKEIFKEALVITIILNSLGNTNSIDDTEINRMNKLILNAKQFELPSNIINDIKYIVEENYKLISNSLDIVKNLNNRGFLGRCISIRTEISIFMIENYFQNINIENLLKIQNWFFINARNFDQDDIIKKIQDQIL